MLTRPWGLQERYTEATSAVAARRPPEPGKVPASVPARPSALELKVEELEEKGLIRILRGPGDAVSIEILPVAVATPGGEEALTPEVPASSPSSGAQGLPARCGAGGSRRPSPRGVSGLGARLP